MFGWLPLLVEVFAVWILWGVAAVTSHAAVQAGRGIPLGRRGGISLAPIIPVFPFVFFGAAVLIDVAVEPWGTVLISWLHAVLGGVFVWYISRAVWLLRSLDNAATGAPRE